MLISIKISRNSAFPGLDKSRLLFFLLINVKMPTIVGMLTFFGRKKFTLSWVEHDFLLKSLGQICLDSLQNAIIININDCILQT